jgi:hypothetical protein
MSAFDTVMTTNIENIKNTIEDTQDIKNTIEDTQDIKNTIEDTQEIKPNTEVKSIFKIELDVLKSEIEKAVNPKTIEESVYLLSNPNELINRMQQGANMFKEKTGRNMTYSELREMYG